MLTAWLVSGLLVSTSYGYFDGPDESMAAATIRMAMEKVAPAAGQADAARRDRLKQVLSAFYNEHGNEFVGLAISNFDLESGAFTAVFRLFESDKRSVSWALTQDDADLCRRIYKMTYTAVPQSFIVTGSVSDNPAIALIRRVDGGPGTPGEAEVFGELGPQGAACKGVRPAGVLGGL